MKETINRVLADKINGKRIPGVDAKIVVDNGVFLWQDMGLDSLDVMEVIIECEGVAGKSVPNEKINGIKTKDDLYKLFENAD